MAKQQLSMIIVSNEPLGEHYSLMTLMPSDGRVLPDILPGQFVSIDIPDSKYTFLRRPISINDVRDNMIKLLIRVAGEGTRILCRLASGRQLNVLLPLGCGFPTEIDKKDKVLIIGGGVGVAPLLYYGRKLREMNIECTFALGVRSKNDLLLLDDFSAIAPVEVSTEDGSFGVKGFVTDCPALNCDYYKIWAVCGPMPMMQAVASLARKTEAECYVSLENKMACGIGACLCCVEDTVVGHQCVCTSGPVFNAKELLWNK